MDRADLQKSLHIINSVSIEDSLKKAWQVRSEQILINDDPITVGPAPATDDLDVWRATRSAYFRKHFIQSPIEGFPEYEQNWLTQNTERLAAAQDVIVWLARGLPEQLLLAWMVFLFERLDLDLSKLRVVQFDQSPEGHVFLGVAEIHPEQIRRFAPPPRRLTRADAAELRRAWQVYTSDDPVDLATHADGSSSMTFLHQGICQLIDRYPERRSGLSIWDEALLRYTVERGPNAARVIGSAMGFVGSERLDYVSDDYLFPRLTAMGGRELNSALVSINGSSRIMRVCRVRPTPFGERVLAGGANHVAANGIDDWVGGVHLSSSDGAVPFRDDVSSVPPN